VTGLGTRLRAVSARLATRLVAGLLIASLPISIALAVVLTENTSTSLHRATSTGGEALARSVTLRVEGWLSFRSKDIAVVASEASGRLADPATTALVTKMDKTYAVYQLIEVVDHAGHVTAASRATGTFDVAGEAWFAALMSGDSVTTSLREQNGEIRWIVAEPVRDGSGLVQGAVVGNLDAAVLPGLLNPELSHGQSVMTVDSDHRLLYDSSMGKISDDAALLAKGSLHTKVDNAAVNNALAGKPGDTAFRDLSGHQAIGGYDNLDVLGWAIVISKSRAAVLAPVTNAQHLALLLVLLGAALTVAFSIWFARRTTRPILRLADTAETVASGDLAVRALPEGASELRRLGEAFNTMVESLGQLVMQTNAASAEMSASAAQLSASSEELAATTTEQSASVTEVSATTEELARASSSIADTVDEVAAQASETRDNLEQAEADIQASSERTLALSVRVNEIGSILTLINEIADQTNLLALNAAIEAARAGESGRGFAVVAEEVRRLAERSKSSAADIAVIADGVHAETNATVMAMEKGAKQMQRGLALLEEVTQATAQVRLTTQQQRSATGQVVETMDQLTDASRQVSATAQEIAAASASLAGLAENLERTAEAAKDRY
jgi:methyl-accepting chemotaxis protein